MTGIVSNALAVAGRIQAKLRALDNAVDRGLRKIGSVVERGQIKRLGGSQKPTGAYPVPTYGHLRREVFNDTYERFVLVGNKSTYALVVHEGLGSSKKYGRRPFLEDAVNEVDSNAIMAVEIRKALEAV